MKSRLIKYRLKSFFEALLGFNFTFFLILIFHPSFDLDNILKLGNTYLLFLIIGIMAGYLKSFVIRKVELINFSMTSVEFENLLINEFKGHKLHKIGSITQLKPSNKLKRLKNVWGFENIEYKTDKDSIVIIANEKHINRLEKILETTAIN